VSLGIWGLGMIYEFWTNQNGIGYMVLEFASQAKI